MKIATLTLPLHTNYGGIMQAYALQKVIIELGHSSELIYLTPTVYRPFCSVILPKIKAALINLITVTTGGRFISRHRNLEFERFIKNEITRTTIEYKFQINNKTVQNFDAYIVGSDQVWRADYAKNIETYFFDFIKRDKTFISYAASFGGDVWGYDEEQTKNCGRLAKRFTSVSVRENAAVELCQKYFNISAIRLLDPTLLLDIKYYKSIISKYSSDKTQGSPKIFSYLLDTNEVKENLALEIGGILDTDVIIFNKDLTNSEKLNFGEWLQGFENAAFVLTDSFHGVAFSIIFNKPFIAIGNIERGLSRFETILDVFNLRERLFIEGDGKISDIVNSNIDYKVVNEILHKEKGRSLKFLTENLTCKK
jgi:hypothetical protein